MYAVPRRWQSLGVRFPLRWQGSCEGLCSAREHLLRVPNQMFDMRDLDQVLLHFHDAEIETGEGSEPPGRNRIELHSDSMLRITSIATARVPL